MERVASVSLRLGVSWFESSGGAAPVFSARALPAANGFAYAIAIADVDRNGSRDLLASWLPQDQDVLRVYFNGGGPEPDFTEYQTVGGWVAGLDPADLDADGDTDIAVIDYVTAIPEPRWYENSGAWGLCEPPSTCTADTDGDGEVSFEDLLAVLFAWGPCPE